MKLRVLISNFVVLLALASPSGATFCSDGFSKEQRENFFHLRCHCSGNENTKDEYEETISKSLDVRLQDKSSIVVEFDFPANPCTFQRYSIELNYVNLTGVPKGNCSIYHPENHTLDDDLDSQVTPLRHSLRNYHTSNQTSYGQQCPKRATVEFHHVFDGCYFVSITPYKSGANEGNKKAVFSRPAVLSTGVTKSDVELMNTTAKVHTTPKLINGTAFMTSRFTFDDRSLHMVPTIVSISLKMMVDLRGDGACTRSGFEYNCCEIMNDDDSTFLCTSHFDPNKTTNCKFDSGETFTSVECTMPTNFNGNYCVLVEIKDDRCPSVVGDIWSLGHDPHAQSCIWHHKGYLEKVVPPSEVITRPAPPEWYVWLILALVILFVLGFLFYYFYLLLRRGFLAGQPTDEEGGSDVINTALPLLSVENQKILLLYARDCEKFMEVMAHFREMLSDCCKREVIDLYHESYEQDLNQQGSDFLLELLRKNKTFGKGLFPEVTVVIVLSECGIAHHVAQMKGTRLEYKEQESFDSFFPLALKTLKEDVQTNMYNRVHVVEFSAFKIPAKSPEIFINALTRYKMPRHLKELVRALLRANNKSDIDVCEDSYQELLDKIEDLVAYRKENPDYLASLIGQVAMNGNSTQLNEEK
ncbi:uncharacterized protein LOC132193726 [Neocloeon triangulifer]|uniref:uncharacterized protein LOC132193726 n=1 Tax=Neocloeon triangulifer TaxID=2078957 RepID=UPI00286EBB7B|nr:uncharacterized protein LOC132193726 [Neocloeon triangulifer]